MGVEGMWRAYLAGDRSLAAHILLFLLQEAVALSVRWLVVPCRGRGGQSLRCRIDRVGLRRGRYRADLRIWNGDLEIRTEAVPARNERV